MAKASIITIGDELLIGQVIDTNSSWMAAELNKSGISVIRRVAVGDDAEEITKALDAESQHADIILITGGLGPTADDITKPVLCRYFNTELVMNGQVLQFITDLFENRIKRPLLDRNRKQAEVPAACEIIMNYRGTAPGMLFRKHGKIFISMPGVPYEMQGILEAALPVLTREFVVDTIEHRTLLTAGIGESVLADRLESFEAALPGNIKLAYLPNYGMVRLRLTARGQHSFVTKELDEKFRQLQLLVKEYLVIDEDKPMEVVLGELLKAKGKTIGTAESCTGGYIAHLISSIPGASAYYNGSMIAYSNELKERLLGVDKKIFITEGAVSRDTVLSMAAGALASLNCDYIIATSGIMGPDGGSAGKPVGTVWVAYGTKNNIQAEKYSFRWDRKRNIELTARQAMNSLRKFILTDN